MTSSHHSISRLHHPPCGQCARFPGEKKICPHRAGGKPVRGITESRRYCYAPR